MNVNLLHFKLKGGECQRERSRHQMVRHFLPVFGDFMDDVVQ